MGEIREFTFSVQLFLRAYQWRRINPTPWTPLLKPLSECRLALVSSAGFHLADQRPFDVTTRGGDISFRWIPHDAEISALIESHRSNTFDHSGIRLDPNLAFPIDRVRKLEETGRVGSINKRHLSLMGSITAPGRLIRDTAPRAARQLVEDGVDIALLVPV